MMALDHTNTYPEYSTNGYEQFRFGNDTFSTDHYTFIPPSKNNLSTMDSEASRDNSTSKRKRNKTAKDKQWWTTEEDERLKDAVSSCGAKNWKLISEMADVGKSDVQCLQRWTQVLRPGLKKGTWSKEEDKRLTRLVLSLTDGHQNVSSIPWKKIEKDMGGRTAKQCRERWKLSLDPNINKTVWDSQEDARLLELQREYGNSWSKIKDMLATNRTENAVKLRFKCLKKRQEKFESNLLEYGTQPVVSAATTTHESTSLEESRKRLKLSQELPQAHTADLHDSFLTDPLFSKNFSQGAQLIELDTPLDSIFNAADTLIKPNEFHQMSSGLKVSRNESTKSLEFDEVLQILSDEGSLESWEIV